MNPYTPPAFEPARGLPLIATEPVGVCAVCNAEDFVLQADGFDFELETCRNHWQFWRCTRCDHIQLDPRPTSETLQTIYPPHYYSYAMQKKISAIALAGKAMLDRWKFRNFLAFLGRKPNSYLDIGCGDLKYLDVMRGQGIAPCNLYGLELDAAVVERARACGYSVFQERAETAASIPADAIDVVTMFHVIEHVADPGAVLRSVARWLTPDGILVIETPNTAAQDARLFRRRYWGGYHIPRHWHLFTPEGLARLLSQTGFQPVATHYQTGHSFWLYSFHHLLRYNSVLPMPRLARLFDPLHSLFLLAGATAWDKLRALLGWKTSAMLVIARRTPPA